MARRAIRLLDPDLTVVFGGVDCAAVRTVLAQAHEDLTRTLEEVERLRRTHADVMTELVAAQEQEREATRTLSKAEQDARQIREAAQRDALRLVAAAERRAASMLEDAERQLTSIVGPLHRWRERRVRLASLLQAELDDLAAFSSFVTGRANLELPTPSVSDAAAVVDPALPGDLAYEAVPEPAPDAFDPSTWAPGVSMVPDPNEWTPTPAVPSPSVDWAPAAAPESPEPTPAPLAAEPRPMDWSLPIEPLPLGEPMTAAAPQPVVAAPAPRRAVPVAISSKPVPLIRRALRPGWMAAAVAMATVLIVAVLAWPRAGSSPAASAAASAKPAKATVRKPSAAASASQKTPRTAPRAVDTDSIPRDGMQLAIRATSPCWIKLTIGERSESRLLTPGETLTRHSRSDVFLRAGDAGALEVTVNGLKLPPLGPEGAVVTKRISPPIDGSAAR
jgi:hypothetical protein